MSSLENAWLEITGPEKKHVLAVLTKSAHNSLQNAFIKIFEDVVKFVFKGTNVILKFNNKEDFDYFCQNFEVGWISPVTSLRQIYKPIITSIEEKKAKKKISFGKKKIIFYGSKVPFKGIVFRFSKVDHPPIRICYIFGINKRFIVPQSNY